MDVFRFRMLAGVRIGIIMQYMYAHFYEAGEEGEEHTRTHSLPHSLAAPF